MSRRLILLAFFSAALATAPSRAADDPQASEALKQLFAAQWERGLQESPESASNYGDRRFNDG